MTVNSKHKILRKARHLRVWQEIIGQLTDQKELTQRTLGKHLNCGEYQTINLSLWMPMSGSPINNKGTSTFIPKIHNL